MRLFQAGSGSRTPGRNRLTAAVLLLAAQAAVAADLTLPDYLPSETKVVFGIRMRTIADLVHSQNFAAEWGAATSRLLTQTPMAGFDPLKDIDEVLVATSGEGEKPPALVVLTGRFDAGRLTGGQDYKGVMIVEDAGKSGALAILDASTAIAGELAQVRAAIDRRGSGAGIAAGLASRVEALRSKYSIWGLGDRAERPAAHSGQADVTDSVDRFEFGAELGHGLELTAEIHVRTPEDAEKMAAAFSFAQGILKAHEESTSGTQFEMQGENGLFKVTLKVPEEAMSKAIQEQRSVLQSAVMSQLTTFSPGAPIQPVAKPRLKPVIPAGGKVVSNAEGETMVVTLPGKR